MGWTTWPPTAGTNVSTYAFQMEARYALQEKFKALGNDIFPASSIPATLNSVVVQSQSTVTSVTDNGDGTIAIVLPTTPGWGVGNPCCPPGQKRWVEYVCNDCDCPLCYIPIRYDIVILPDPRDPLTQIRAPITDQAIDGDTGTLTVTASPILNAVTAKFITGLGVLSGKTSYIIKRGAPWIADRLPDAPIDPEQWQGGATAADGYWPADDTTDPTTGVVTHAGPLYTVLTDADDHVSWATDRWPDAGTEVMIFAGPHLLRLPIRHNEGRDLYVDHQVSTPEGAYLIVAPGDRAMPGRPRWLPFKWHYGASQFEASHTPDDAIETANVPQTMTHWSVGNPCSLTSTCTGDSEHPDPIVQSFDIDVQKPADSEALCICGQAGDFINPNIFKSLRMVQKTILDIAPFFIPKDFAGGEKPKPFNAASLLAWCGINSGSSSLSWVTSTGIGGVDTSHYEFYVDIDYAGKDIYFEVVAADGSTKTSGRLPANAEGAVTVSDDVSHNNGDTPNDDGLTVVYSAGFTRIRKRLFAYLYPKTSFVPDPRPVLSGGGVYDPPAVGVDDNGHYDCGGKGTWIKRGASAGALIVGETGEVYDGGEAFVTGECYRCIGDNYQPPFPGGPTDHPLVTYFDKFYRGTLNRQNEAARAASRSGRVAAGTTYSASAASPTDWWSDWANGGTLRTESLTATAGGTTSITDSSKDTTNPALPWSCWYAVDRFGTGDPYVGFVLQVQQVQDGVTFTYRLPITGFTNLGAGGVRLSFAAVKKSAGIAFDGDGVRVARAGGDDNFTIAVGDTATIPEPAYELNKWESRTVTFKTPAGSTIGPLTIRQSDKDTLYFDAQAQPIPGGSTFAIAEDRFGGVWQWNGTKMVKPTTDAVRLGVTEPVDFHDNQAENFESLVKDFGLIHYADVMTGVTLYTELYNALNALKKQRGDYAWTNKTSATDTEGEINSGYAYSYYKAVDNAIEQFRSLYSPTDKLDNAAPWQHGELTNVRGPKGGSRSSDPVNFFTTLACFAGGGGRFAYGKVVGIPTYRPCTVQFWATGHGISSGVTFYNAPTPPYSGFIPFSGYSGPGTEDEPFLWASVGGSDAVRYTSSRLGPDVTVPPSFKDGINLIPEGSYWGSEGENDSGPTTGYTITEAFTIIDWDMEFTA